MPILQTVQEGLVAVPQEGKEQSCLENSEVASSWVVSIQVLGYRFCPSWGWVALLPPLGHMQL